MKRHIINILILLLIISVSACSNIKKPSKSSFKNILSTYYAEGYYLKGTKTFPLLTERGDKLHDGFTEKVYSILLDARIFDLTAQPNKFNIVNGIKYYYGSIYELTEAGKKYYEQGKGLKLYDFKDIEVLEFSEPADENGYKVSTVKYKGKVIPSELLKLIDKNVKEEVLEKNAKMYLTDTGWKIME